ncbi:MAG: T9SS type A sorting domain-containing protein [Rufibacter sp.]
MEFIYRQRQFLATAAFLAFFAGLLYLAFALPGLNQRNHFSAAGVKEAGRIARAERLHKKGAIGTEEDPQARQNYEIMRLQDPATGKIPEGIRELELAYAHKLMTVEQVERANHPNSQLASVNWDKRGPYNIGGRTRALAIDVNNENVILAGGVSGGMWRSANGGNSWVKVTDPNQLHSVTTVAQDKRAGKTNTWYYGTGEIIGNSANAPGASYYGNGLYKSIDNGVTWNPLVTTQAFDYTSFTKVFQYTYRVATNPANQLEDEVFAATAGAIQRSVNGGATWNYVLGFGKDVSDFNASPLFTDIAIASNGAMYATLSQYANGGGTATKRGIFRSTDGVNWTNITPAAFPGTYERIVLDIAPSNENIVYFLVYTNNFLGEEEPNLWKYEHSAAGGTWTNLTANIPMLGGRSGNLDLQGGYNMVVKVKPNNPNYVVLGGTNLYRSTNGFTSTTATTKIGGYEITNQNYSLYPNHHPDQHEVVFYKSNPDRMISAHDGGLSRSANNQEAQITWESLNRGYQTTQFYTVAMDLNTTDDFVVGGMQDNGSWAVEDINEQSLWSEVLGGDGAYTAVTTHSMLVSVQNGTVYRLAYGDNGQYLGFSRIDPPKATGYLFVNPYTIDPNNEYTMFLPAGDTLWRNKNIAQIPYGGNQSNLGWEVVAKLNTNEVISSVSVSRNPANVVYFGTSGGRLYKFADGSMASPTRTEITGANFPKTQSGTPTGYINCIAIDPRDANKAIVVFTNYKIESLFYTQDGGTSWTPISGNLEEDGFPTGNGPSTRWVTILPNPDGSSKYFVGTSTGLYSTGSLNGFTTTWMREGNNTIGQVPVDMVLSRTTDDLVIVGTHGNGVFSRRYTGPLASTEEVKIAKQQVLGQSYPNPFRQGTNTTIPVTLEKAAQVTLQIYSLTGRRIATLINDKLDAGAHKITWDGRGASAGTYLYKLTVDGKQYAKRLVLLR